jgi:hypothetical protein
LGARPWCISQAGFTPEAEQLASGRGILISAGEDLARLARLVQ